MNGQKDVKFRLGVNLVESLMVIAIIGVLIGMLLLAVHQVSNAARRLERSNDVRQIVLAPHNIESASDSKQLAEARFGHVTMSSCPVAVLAF